MLAVGDVEREDDAVVERDLFADGVVTTRGAARVVVGLELSDGSRDDVAPALCDGVPDGEADGSSCVSAAAGVTPLAKPSAHGTSQADVVGTAYVRRPTCSIVASTDEANTE